MSINSPGFSGCGFVGAIAFNNNQKKNILDHIHFEDMMNSIRHRGPEAGGFWKKDNIMLGHRRLSILDLSERGNQPMTRDHLTIVSNGEIYNFTEIRRTLEAEGFKFTSQTDTEVILRAYQKWGIEALLKFNGMFAIAIWDDIKKKLFLARDRIGIKPLYYYKDNDLLLFGSEVQALMHSRHIPADINWEVVQKQVLINAIYQHELTQTPVKNVYSIPFGHFMIINPDGHIKMEKYWDLPETKFTPQPSHSQMVNELKELMEDSIRYRLVSDVPVAAFLSGGMDSSVINVLASRLEKTYKLTAITVSYEGGGKDIYSQTEDQDLKYSKIVTDSLKDQIDHQIIYIKPAEITLDSIDKVIDLATFMDDDRMLTIHQNYKTVHEQGFKVVLNGQGADEIMAGYISSKFIIDTMLDVKNPAPDLIKQSYRLMSIPSPDTLNDEIKNHAVNLYDELNSYYQHFPGTQLEKLHRFLMNTELQKVLKFEDFLSMSSSVECRLPFLDQRLIEWAFKLPFHLHIRKGDRMGKILLRDAATGLLPDSVTKRPKQAFPSQNQDFARIALQHLYKEHHREITRSNLVSTLYKKEFLSSPVPQISSRELWLLISLWRWETRFRSFRQ